MIGNDMFDEYEWNENSNGNYVARDSYDHHVGTVHHNRYKWLITLNIDDVGHNVKDEYFDSADGAMSRAEDILNGAECNLVQMRPNAGPVTSLWKEQKTVANGAPTYGRKVNGKGVSVKKAKSGQWYYVIHSNPKADGWSTSAELAMQTFDATHP